MIYYKATQPDGTDFYTGTIDYAKAGETAAAVLHPDPGVVGDVNAKGYLSVSITPTDCTSFRWPARLFEVAAIGDVWAPASRAMPSKRAVHELVVVAERPAWELFGPRGEGCVTILERFETLSSDERTALSAARESEWWKAWDRLWSVADDGRADRAGLRAARYALSDRRYGWDDDSYAAYGAALAVLLSGFPELAMSDDDYATLTAPWRSVVGNAHPNDELPAKGTVLEVE